MSIVLEALEKAQKEGKRPIPTYIAPVVKEDLKPLHRPRYRQKIFVFSSILVIAVVNFIILGWWLNRDNSTISVNIPIVSRVPIIKNIPTKKTSPFSVTGVVWDEKEPVAIVNGKFLKKGDGILGAKIIDIKLHEVRFLRRDKEFAISVE